MADGRHARRSGLIVLASFSPFGPPTGKFYLQPDRSLPITHNPAKQNSRLRRQCVICCFAAELW